MANILPLGTQCMCDDKGVILDVCLPNDLFSSQTDQCSFACKCKTRTDGNDWPAYGVTMCVVNNINLH